MEFDKGAFIYRGVSFPLLFVECLIPKSGSNGNKPQSDHEILTSLLFPVFIKFDIVCINTQWEGL
jgi:hypothetical protein